MDFLRLHPFEGFCLTARDLQDEQTYHRNNLARHALFLHSHGIVQGLKLELETRRGKYVAVISAGYGITSQGQGVELREPKQVLLEVPKQDGEYMLWLFHVEQPDDDTRRPVFDTNELRPSRIKESAAPALLPAEEDHPDAVALARLNVYMGRMVHVLTPVPRAGRQARAAESYLKPRVVEFIRLNRRVMANLFRTALISELDLPVFSFSSALVSSEFLLIEEGTTDRVLYRTAGSLITYAHDYYNALPRTTKRVEDFTKFIQRVNREIPGDSDGDHIWLKWFEKFERLLQPLTKINDELEKTVEAQR